MLLVIGGIQHSRPIFTVSSTAAVHDSGTVAMRQAHDGAGENNREWQQGIGTRLTDVSESDSLIDFEIY